MQFTAALKNQTARQFYHYLNTKGLLPTWAVQQSPAPTPTYVLNDPYKSAMAIILQIKRLIPYSGNVYNAMAESDGESLVRYHAFETAVYATIDAKNRALRTRPIPVRWILSYCNYLATAAKFYKGGCCREITALGLELYRAADQSNFLPYRYVSAFIGTHNFLVLSKETIKDSIANSSDALLVDPWPMWAYPVFLKDSIQKVYCAEDSCYTFEIGRADYAMDDWHHGKTFTAFSEADRDNQIDYWISTNYMPVSWLHPTKKSFVAAEETLQREVAESGITPSEMAVDIKTHNAILNKHKQTTPVEIPLRL